MPNVPSTAEAAAPWPRDAGLAPGPTRPARTLPPRTPSAAESAAGQLSLGLDFGLPGLPLEPDWQRQPRLWGHSLHPMASYLASFPAALVHAFIARYSRRGDIVLDPFSGRGTVPLQACAEGRVGVGNDLNPLAYLLTAAKVEPAEPAEAATRLLALRVAWTAEAGRWDDLGRRAATRPGQAEVAVPAAGALVGSGSSSTALEPVPEEVALAFHPRTLGQLLFVRAALDQNERVDRFLLAALTGILHGKRPSYLSDVMPNAFSMARRYVRTFIRESGYRPPERDVFALLEAKLRRLYRDPIPRTAGLALLGDARDVGGRLGAELRRRALPDRVRLVVGSPPYLRVVKYGYYNWLRAWLLGLDAAAIDASLDDAHRREPYLAFLRDVLAGLRPLLTTDGIVVLVIGDVERDRGRAHPEGLGLAEQVWQAAAEPLGYELAGVIVDRVAAGRKMTKVWGEEAGRATKTDRILVLGATRLGARRALGAATIPVDWSWPPGLVGGLRARA
ncbi:MAG TPA: DNA methyltransferase [Candidatus Binatia bacterium]|nr:DNA methyltransferase [Candidatus Binatia bacterium]